MKNVSRLLLVDDQTTMLTAWARECRRAGKQALLATARAEALALAREARPQIAIVDLFLERENGMALVAELKEIVEDIFVAVVSAHMTVAYAMEAIARGADRCYVKPMSCLEVVQLVEDGSVTGPDLDARMTLEQMEWEAISRALIDSRHNISAAARQLGMQLSTLRRRLDQRGLLPLPPYLDS